MYIACQTTRSDSYLQWNEDVFQLLTTKVISLRRKGFIVIALGDFNTRVGNLDGLENNTPDTNRNTPMFMNFVSQVNMVILNTLPMAKGLFTRFMDSSGRPGTRSLLDYGMVDGDHTNTVKSFVIDETARYDCGSDHALLEVDMEFGVRPKLNWSIQDVLKFNIPEKADFTDYHQNQDNFSSTIGLDHFTDLTVEQMLPHISDTLTKSAMKSFGLKVKKTNPKGNMLPKSIIRMIRSKNKVSRDYHQAVANSDLVKSEHLQDELQKLKDQVNDSIASIRLGRRQRLRNTLLKADPTRKKFWRFLKGQMKTAGNITALNNKEGKMFFEQN